MSEHYLERLALQMQQPQDDSVARYLYEQQPRAIEYDTALALAQSFKGLEILLQSSRAAELDTRLVPDGLARRPFQTIVSQINRMIEQNTFIRPQAHIVTNTLGFRLALLNHWKIVNEHADRSQDELQVFSHYDIGDSSVRSIHFGLNHLKGRRKQLTSGNILIVPDLADRRTLLSDNFNLFGYTEGGFTRLDIRYIPHDDDQFSVIAGKNRRMYSKIAEYQGGAFYYCNLDANYWK